MPNACQQNLLMFLERYLVPINYKIPISYFLIDIDFISKIFNISLNNSSVFVGARFSKIDTLGFPNVEICKNSILKTCSVFSRFLLGVLVSPEIKIVGFGAWGHVP